MASILYLIILRWSCITSSDVSFYPWYTFLPNLTTSVGSTSLAYLVYPRSLIPLYRYAFLSGYGFGFAMWKLWLDDFVITD